MLQDYGERIGWQKKLRGHGYRFTVPRQAILDILSGTSCHLSAEDIYVSVHRVYPNVGLTTVYRNLRLMVKMGMVEKSNFGDGKARYEISKSAEGNKHQHLICTKCGKAIDYKEFIDKEKEILKEIEKELFAKYRFRVTDYVAQFYGLCDNCQKEIAPKSIIGSKGGD